MKTNFNTSAFKRLIRHLNHLEQIHQHDTEILNNLKFAKNISYQSESAYAKIEQFFAQDRDLFGEHSQDDREAFIKLCKKIKDDDPNGPELEISIDTPQRTQRQIDRDDGGILFERTAHLFSGRSPEQERLERERILRESQQHQNTPGKEHTQKQNFAGPFNSVAEHEAHKRGLERKRQWRRTVEQQIRPTRGQDRGPDLSR